MPSLGKAAASTRGSQDWCMLSITRSASSMTCGAGGGGGARSASGLGPGLPPWGRRTRRRRCWRLNPGVCSTWSTRRPGVATTMSARQRKPSALRSGEWLRRAARTDAPDVGTLWTAALRSPGPGGHDAAAQSRPALGGAHRPEGPTCPARGSPAPWPVTSAQRAGRPEEEWHLRRR